jgi:hypothetical protein
MFSKRGAWGTCVVWDRVALRERVFYGTCVARGTSVEGNMFQENVYARTCHRTHANSVPKSERHASGANGSLIFGGSLLRKEPSNGVAVRSVGTSGTPPQGSVVKSRQARRGGVPRAVEKDTKFRVR